MTDMDFLGGTISDAKYHALVGSNVYLYSFDYLSPSSKEFAYFLEE